MRSRDPTLRIRSLGASPTSSVGSNLTVDLPEFDLWSRQSTLDLMSARVQSSVCRYEQFGPWSGQPAPDLMSAREWSSSCRHEQPSRGMILSALSPLWDLWQSIRELSVLVFQHCRVLGRGDPVSS